MDATDDARERLLRSMEATGQRSREARLEHQLRVERERNLRLADRIKALEASISELDLAEDDAEREVTIGQLRLVPSRRWAMWRGSHVKLTKTEYEIVRRLSARPDRVFSREQIMDMIDPNVHIDDRTIDSHIKRLRLRFRAVDPEFNQVMTHYGAGYCWRARTPASHNNYTPRSESAHNASTK